jgi:competence protein ComEA
MKRVNGLGVWVVVLWLLGGLGSMGWAAEQPGGATGKQVNINTADSRQLETLPRIGPKVALRILEYRKANGPFKKTADLMKVKGIGPKTFEKLQAQIVI